MTTHPLSRPLTVEPHLDPPDDPPMIECELCGQECEARPFSPYCEGCESLLRMDVDGLRALVIDLQDKIVYLEALTKWLNGQAGHVCDCRGTGVLTDDQSSHCHCGRAS